MVITPCLVAAQVPRRLYEFQHVDDASADRLLWRLTEPTPCRGGNMTEPLQPAEAKGGNVPRASANVRHLSRMELPGGGQVVVQGKYAFVGHQHRPDGTTILDIPAPRKPVIVSKLMTSHPMSHS